MPDQRSKTRAIPCPKCHGTETVRTGAYNIDTRHETTAVARDETQVTIVYDRRCSNCGHIFMEVVESHDVA